MRPRVVPRADEEHSFRRIKEFFDWTPETLDDRENDNEKKDLLEVWPRQGGIQFKNVSARYRPDLEPALKELSFKIRAGEVNRIFLDVLLRAELTPSFAQRVGIVGRTGGILSHSSFAGSNSLTSQGAASRLFSLRFFARSLSTTTGS